MPKKDERSIAEIMQDIKLNSDYTLGFYGYKSWKDIPPLSEEERKKLYG